MLLKLIVLSTALYCGVDSLQCDGTSCQKSVCPNTTVIYSCNLPPLNSQLGYTKWSFSTIVGNCSVGYIALRQPIITQGCTEQTRTCGYYTASMFMPCTMSSLAVMITQDLNGTIIQCLNIDTLGNMNLLGTSSIVVSGFKKAPGTPKINIAKDCNALSVGWVPSSSGDPAISFAVHIQGHGTDEVVTVDEGASYNLYFSGLESNTLYSITVTAINCAGSNKVNTTVYTLPTPPNDVHALHVGIGTNSAYLVMVWTQMGAPSNQWYNLRVSGSPFVNINKSCSGSTCYFKIDQATLNIPPPYSVEVAAISNGQMGPYGLPLKSAASGSSFLYATSSALYNTTNILCIFLDGSSHQCLICCQYEPKGPYMNSILTNATGILVSGVLDNLARGHTYQCIAAAGDASTTCEGTDTNGVVQFEVATFPLINIVGGTTAEVSSQDSNHITVKCRFYDGSSHYCLLCCSTDPSVQVSAYSNVSSSSGLIAYVDLYGLKPGAVYYCKAFATDDVNKKCAASQANTESLIIYLAVGILSSLVSVVLVLLLLYGCYAIKKKKSIIPSIRVNDSIRNNSSLPMSDTDERKSSTPLQQGMQMEGESQREDSYSYIKARHARNTRVDRSSDAASQPAQQISDRAPLPVPQIVNEQYDYIKTKRSAAYPSTRQPNAYISNSEAYLESIEKFRGDKFKS